MSPTSNGELMVVDNRKRSSLVTKTIGGGGKDNVSRKSIDTFGQRTSQYRGVTRYVFIYLIFNFFKF